VLRRAITTANLALDAADRHWIPVRRDWRLNERHYGALQGLDKAATREKYGDEQFMLWRRSFDTPPPPIEVGSEFDQTGDPRYAGIDMPLTECLKDVIAADDALLGERDPAPTWRDGKTVLVTAHGNSLRALVKHLDGISDDDIAGLNIPTGMPLVYDIGEDFMPTGAGEYLDPEARIAARGRWRRWPTRAAELAGAHLALTRHGESGHRVNPAAGSGAVEPPDQKDLAP
jgi:2,3-bisphosphoglycerate-dependent phosphoglycerate mutase